MDEKQRGASLPHSRGLRLLLYTSLSAHKHQRLGEDQSYSSDKMKTRVIDHQSNPCALALEEMCC